MSQLPQRALGDAQRRRLGARPLPRPHLSVAELVLVRHGESMGNAAGARIITTDRRDADVPLSPTGEQQAEALGAGLRELLADNQPAVVWCSPYVRAHQTAVIGLHTAGAALPIALDERVRDRELGFLDLLTTLGVHNRYPIEAQRRAWLGKF